MNIPNVGVFFVGLVAFTVCFCQGLLLEEPPHPWLLIFPIAVVFPGSHYKAKQIPCNCSLYFLHWFLLPTYWLSRWSLLPHSPWMKSCGAMPCSLEGWHTRYHDLVQMSPHAGPFQAGLQQKPPFWGAARNTQDNPCGTSGFHELDPVGRSRELHYSCSPLLFKWVLLAFPALSLEESIDVCPLSGILVLLSGIKQLWCESEFQVFFWCESKFQGFFQLQAWSSLGNLNGGRTEWTLFCDFSFLLLISLLSLFLLLLVLCSFSLILVHLCSGVDVPWVSDSQMLDFSLLGCFVGFRTPFPKRVSGTACCITPWLVASPSYWPFTVPFPWASCSWDCFAFGVESF